MLLPTGVAASVDAAVCDGVFFFDEMRRGFALSHSLSSLQNPIILLSFILSLLYSEIIAFLVPLLDDKYPLIRSISCWTLSRFSKYIVQGAHREGHDQFEKVLMGLLRRLVDDNKRVQEAACSAFATLEEEAAEELVPRLDIILQHLMWAFGKYQRRNLRIVYDALGTLADAVGGELNQALGTGFSQFAQPVYQRCISIIQAQQLAKADPVSAGTPYDKEFIVCSLDLLSGLTEGLGPGIESLVCPVHLHPRLAEFLDVSAKQLNLPKLKETVSVANNACWAIGELAIKVRKEISPVVLTVVSALVLILQHPEGLNKSLIENAAITLGRLAWVCPELVSPHMEHFMQSWCIALSMIRDDIEKEDAFRGLCAMVRENSSGALKFSSLYVQGNCKLAYAQGWSMGTMHVCFGATCEGQAAKISTAMIPVVEGILCDDFLLDLEVYHAYSIAIIIGKLVCAYLNFVLVLQGGYRRSGRSEF
ncbi:hypothetical protein SASPL_131037 [Salvia splendens]|uniref:Transportin-1 n=1 Tax=Salvia splendens TaxID=180675 RepID=A0A8X8X9B3_SALSN|nr:hypothetical protein SASPL_131037 [Salvia splendens]